MRAGGRDGVRVNIEKVLDRADAVVRETVIPAVPRVDDEGQWPAESMSALQAAGLAGLVVPEDAGGLGHGMVALFEVTRRIGRASASTAMCFGMHCVGSAVIAAKATGAQRASYLEPIADGTHITTLALSEPGSGSQFWFPASTLGSADEGFVVNGTKSFVTNGGHADSYVMSTVAAAEAPLGEFSCVVVDDSAPGLRWSGPWHGMGMRGNSSRTVELHDVVVSEHALLGAPGDQIWYVFNAVAPYFLVAMAGTYLGLAEAALEEARLHVTERRHAHDGSRLAQQSLVQHRIGTLWAALARSRTLCTFAAEEGDRGGPEALLALCSAKAEVGETATGVVNESMTLLGGIGYREGGAMERRLRDVRAAHVMAPTTDQLRLWAGRVLLGEHLLAE